MLPGTIISQTADCSHFLSAAFVLNKSIVTVDVRGLRVYEALTVRPSDSILEETKDRLGEQCRANYVRRFFLPRDTVSNMC